MGLSAKSFSASFTHKIITRWGTGRPNMNLYNSLWIRHGVTVWSPLAAGLLSGKAYPWNALSHPAVGRQRLDEPIFGDQDRLCRLRCLKWIASIAWSWSSSDCVRLGSFAPFCCILIVGGTSVPAGLKEYFHAWIYFLSTDDLIRLMKVRPDHLQIYPLCIQSQFARLTVCESGIYSGIWRFWLLPYDEQPTATFILLVLKLLSRDWVFFWRDFGAEINFGERSYITIERQSTWWVKDLLLLTYI